MIIGLSGKKGSGKTTIGRFLQSRLDDSEMICFADTLKDLVSDLFDIPQVVLNGTEEQKNMPTHIGDSARKVMQCSGAAMRGIWPDCWVNAWRKRVRTLHERRGIVPVIVADVRYQNEIAAIREAGGMVIRLTRNPYGTDEHESETDLDRGIIEFDAVIDNANLTKDEANVMAIGLCRGWGIE